MINKKTIFSIIIGNIFEWYDYILYAHFSSIIASLFFPSHDRYVSLISAFSVFALGFVTRPLGAILFGRIGDKHGRKAALSLSIIMIAIPTMAIGLIPSYEKIGILAPILLAVSRIVQGISIGGEFSTSATYLIESASDNKKGFTGSFLISSLCVGVLFGSLISYLFEAIFSQQELIGFWWRVPFILSVFIAGLGFYIRRKLSESADFVKMKEEKTLSKSPFSEVFKHYKKPLLLAILTYIGITVSFYVMNVFVKTMMVETVGFSSVISERIGIITITATLISSVITGIISDRIGIAKTMMYGFITGSVLIFPIFMLYAQGIYHLAILAAILSGLCMGFFTAPFAAVFCSIFEPHIRSSAMSVAVNIPAVVFGGTAPMVSTILIQQTGTIFSVAVYCTLTVLISLGALSYMVFILKKR